MDKKDLKILKLLSQDVRKKYSKIAKEIGVTENAIKYRIKRLEKQGIIKNYCLNLNAKELGKNTRVIFMINIKPQDFPEALRKLETYKEISAIFRCAGEYSIICMGFFDDKEKLVEFLDNKLLIDLPIRTWAEQIILKTHKEKPFNTDML